MPTYEYSCEKCGPFELWQSIKDNALTACPTCGSKVERLISANVGFVFKGAGFYQNDYKNHGPSRPEAKPSDSAKAASDKPEAKPSGSAKATSDKPSDPASAPSSGPGCGTCGGPDPCSSSSN